MRVLIFQYKKKNNIQYENPRYIQIILFMLIEQTVQQAYVHTSEYRLTVAYVEKVRKGNVHGIKLKLMLDSKINNYNPQKLTAELQVEEKQLKSLYRKLSSPRLYIHRSTPRLTLLYELSIILRNSTSTFTNKEIQAVDVAINYGEKYWRATGELEVHAGTCAEKVILQINDKPGRREIDIHKLYFEGKSIINLQKQIKQLKYIWQREEKKLKKQQLKQNKLKNCTQLKKIVEQKKFILNQHNSVLQTSSESLPFIPFTRLIIEKPSQNLTEKQILLRKQFDIYIRYFDIHFHNFLLFKSIFSNYHQKRTFLVASYPILRRGSYIYFMQIKIK